jgi:hypothetical protein
VRAISQAHLSLPGSTHPSLYLVSADTSPHLLVLCRLYLTHQNYRSGEVAPEDVTLLGQPKGECQTPLPGRMPPIIRPRCNSVSTSPRRSSKNHSPPPGVRPGYALLPGDPPGFSWTLSSPVRRQSDWPFWPGECHNVSWTSCVGTSLHATSQVCLGSSATPS